MDNGLHVGEIILQERTKLAISQKDISNILGISQSIQSRIERGDKVPEKKYLRAASHFLKINLSNYRLPSKEDKPEKKIREFTDGKFTEQQKYKLGMRLAERNRILEKLERGKTYKIVSYSEYNGSILSIKKGIFEEQDEHKLRFLIPFKNGKGYYSECFLAHRNLTRIREV